MPESGTNPQKMSRQARLYRQLRWMIQNSEKSGFFILTVLIAWCFELIYRLSLAGWPGGFRIFAILWFGSGAAFFLGTVIGFLFGLPKTRLHLASDTGYQSNTNLEEVSDWLTKLIIGAGLVEIHKIVIFVGQVGGALGEAIDPTHSFGGSAIGTGAIIVAFATGFLHYYMWARVIVADIFSKAAARLSKSDAAG